jgi:hypothetical protein
MAAGLSSLIDEKKTRRTLSMMRFLGSSTVLVLFLGSIGQARSDFIYWADYFGGDIRRANTDGSGQLTLVTVGAALGLALDKFDGKIYWADNFGGSIGRANLDGTGQETLVSGLNGPENVRLDLIGGKMYWADDVGGDIRRANLDGTEQEVLVSGLNSPESPVLDLAGGRMYWGSGPYGPGDIRSANLDGSGQQILANGLNGARGPVLDIFGGKMYWADLLGGDVRRANLDGTGQETLVRGLNSPGSPVLDIPRGKMYWPDFGAPGSSTGRILRANLDGSAQETLVKNVDQPTAITLDVAGGLMYWADYSGGDIRRANLDGSGQHTLATGLRGPVSIALDLSTAVPQPVLVTGYNADVISDKDPSARFALPFHAGTFAWFEAGAVDDNGAPHNDGLPAGLTFVSATGSGATYQLQPANASNVLQLRAGQMGTLTLTTPAAYGTLYVIASSGDGTPASMCSGAIKFVDGSTQAFSYNAFDWCNGQGGLHLEAVLPGPNGRADVGPDGRAFVYNQDCHFQVYETVIAIDPAHAGVAIASIEFTGAPDALFSNMFGLSGR